MYNKKIILIATLLMAFVFLLSRCINNQVEAAKDPRGNEYAGAATCRQCHMTIYDSFIGSAHAKATSQPLAENIHGNFSNEDAVFSYNNMTKMVMEKRADGYYQVLYQNGKQNAFYKFDLLFGGRKAQTSAYWQDDRFYELPLSHYASVNAWGTS